MGGRRDGGVEVDAADAVFRAVTGVGCNGSLEHLRSASLTITAAVVIALTATDVTSLINHVIIKLIVQLTNHRLVSLAIPSQINPKKSR